MQTRLIKGLVVSLGLLIGTTANAGLIRFTPLGETEGQQAVIDPVPIGDDGFTMWFHGGGSKEVIDPLILILAVPEGTGGLTGPTLSSDDATITPWDSYLGWDGSVYDDVGAIFGLDPSDDLASQNISNYTDATDFYGLTSTYTWDVYAYAVDFDNPFNPGDSLDITGSLVIGTFVSGWGCYELDDDSNSDWDGNCKKATATPFTWTGLVVPEPGTLSLLGTALIGFGFARRRRG